jgi:hypothetical protein
MVEQATEHTRRAMLVTSVAGPANAVISRIAAGVPPCDSIQISMRENCS